MDKEVFILYYDIDEMLARKLNLTDIYNTFVRPLNEKFDEADKLLIFLPKDITVMSKSLSKEEALKVIDEIKEYIETWQE